MKKCKKCHKEKPKNEFYKNSAKDDGLTIYCKSCIKSKYEPVDKIKASCVVCGNNFKGRKGQKYCSKKCRNRRSRNRKKIEFTCKGCGKVAYATHRKRTNYCTHECYVKDRDFQYEYGKECETCGQQYTASQPNQMYCSDECNPSKWERCLVYFYECCCCSKLFTSDNALRLYCSDDCYHKAQRQYQKQNQIEHWLSQPKRPCKQCGEPFQPKFKKSKTYCSNKCAKKYRRKTRYRSMSGKDHRARAKKYGVFYEPIDKTKVFKRDKYICQSCGIKTGRNLVGKNTNKDSEPTLDHIIPMSCDGPHSYNNVQTLCRRCNTDKSNNLQGQAVIIFNNTPAIE